MRALSILLILWSATLSGLAATLAQSTNVNSLSSSNLIIDCTDGVDFVGSTLIFKRDVRVLEPQMYMECEFLTALFETNTIARPRGDSLTNLNARINTIIAETNLLIMTRDVTIIGDRAVYTASNDVVVVTGLLVIIETERGYTYGTQFVFSRKTGEGYAVGATVVEVQMGSSSSNRAPSLQIGPRERTPAPPRKKEGTP